MGILRRRIWKAWLHARGDSCHYLRRLKSWQYLSHREVQQLQKEGLHRLLTHAFRHVPYYSKILREVGVVTSGGVNIDRFSNIPMLDKSILRDSLEDLRSDDLDERDWMYNTSGGSTGEPVRFIQDHEYAQWRKGVKLLFNEWTGYEPGMRRIQLWGAERDLRIGKETIRTRIGRWLRNEVWLNAYRMSEERMREYIHEINQTKPVQILAYAESMFELARYAEQEGLTIYSPQAIMTSAGALYPYMRETIERVCDAPVFNRYGSREVGDIACECNQHMGLHVTAPTHYVELVSREGVPVSSGEVGEVVVTSLTNYAMPLIRYRIGDMAIASDEMCDCGCAWPLLKRVTGRVSDTFVTKRGERIRGGYFTRLFYFRDWVEKYQVVQEEYDLVRIYIVLRELIREEDVPASDLEEIKGAVQVALGEDCVVVFEYVQEIQPSRSGKYRFTISEVEDGQLYNSCVQERNSFR